MNLKKHPDNGRGFHANSNTCLTLQVTSQVEALEVCVEPNPVVPNLVRSSPEKCVLEEYEAKRGKRDYSCSPVKRKKTEDWMHDSSAQRVVPLFGHARFGVPPSPPVSFPSPCRVTSNVCIEKKIVSSLLPCPPSSPSPSILTVEVKTENNPPDASSPLRASNLSKASSPVEVRCPLKAINGRDSTSPTNIRSKRLFGSVENTVRVEIEKVENTVTVDVEKVENTVTVEKVVRTTFRSSSFRILRLEPLPSLLEFL